MLNLSEITPGKADRALIIGGTRSGKSTLMDWFIRQMVHDRPKVQILLLDSKPRYRTEVERFGPGNRLLRSSERYYRDWEQGPTIPNSVRVNLAQERPLERFWRPEDKLRVAVAQTEETTQRGRLLEIADSWYKTRMPRADRVFAVDELLDFYHRNTISVHSARDVPLKVMRAGGERGFGALYGAQRPKRSPTTDNRGTVRALPIPLEVRKRY